MVLCVEETPQIQAFKGTAPVLPIRPGRIERRSHDWRRHGTTDLFAALDVKAGTGIGACKGCHRATEFRAFLDQVEAAVPADLGVHLVSCCWSGGHLVKVFTRSEARGWDEGYSAASSSSRR